MLLAWSVLPLAAQVRTADQFNAWTHLNTQVQLAPRWWAVQEVQWRRNDGFQHPMQTGFLFMPEYRVGPWALAPGYALWYNYPYGAFPTSAMQQEHRVWLQAAYKHPVGPGSLEHRVRVEDRFLERFNATPDGPVSRGFEPVWRARYRAQWTVPLNGRGDVVGQLYGTLSQEVLVRFGDPTFKGLLDQTRSVAQVGWHCAPHVRISGGYMFQYLVRGNDLQRENDHTLLLGVQLRFPRGAPHDPEPDRDTMHL